jgi:monoamine oxidase
VVGAGLSGLACALVLVQAGVDVRVWEARDRLGGRTLTDTSLVPGKWVECGGEFIDAEHSAIRRLCSESGVTLQDLEAVDTSGVGRDLVAGRVREDGWADAPAARLAERAARDLQRLGEDRLNAMSAAEWLKGAIPGGTGSPFARYQRALTTGEYGADPSALTALWLVTDLADGAGSDEMADGAERYRVNGGTRNLVAALEQRVGAQRIGRGTRLTGLVREGSRPALQLTGPGGPRVERPDRAVITLSPGVLRTVNLSRSGFSTPTRNVIRTYGMGTNAKVIIPFNRAAWETHGWDAEGVSDTALGQTWNSTVGEGAGTSKKPATGTGARKGSALPSCSVEKDAVALEPSSVTAPASTRSTTASTEWATRGAPVCGLCGTPAQAAAFSPSAQAAWAAGLAADTGVDSSAIVVSPVAPPP